MKSHSRKIIAAICIGITVALISAFAHAQDTTNPVTVTPFSTGLSDACAGKDCYSLFSGFADALGGKFDAIQGVDSLGALVNALVALGIGIGGVLAVVLLMYEGYRYMRTDNSPELSTIKANSLNIVMGFLLLLCVFVILRTINPDLLNLTPRIETADFLTGGDPDTVDSTSAVTQYANFKTFAAAHDIPCTGSGGAGQIPAIARAMQGKITYSMEKRGQACANDTFCLDCSGFVNAVYSCVGISSPGYTTSSIFSSGATSISSKTDTVVNGKTLTSGDLLGWTKGSLSGSKQERYGHVIMYIGEGKTIESTGADKSAGQAIQIKNTTKYGQRLKMLRDLP